jgi:hypothetical protein
MPAPLQLPLKYVAIFVVSMMFPALDSITKEKVRRPPGALWFEPASGAWGHGAAVCTFTD